MVRPEPDQPLHKADIGVVGGTDTGACLVEEILPRRRHRVLLRGLSCIGRLVLHRHGVAGTRILRSRGLPAPALQHHLGLPGVVEVEPRAVFRRARGQIRIYDLAGIGRFELGQERALRIGRDRGDRARSRPRVGTEAELGGGPAPLPGVREL